MYIKQPMEIENKSMQLIEEYMKDTAFTDEESIIVKRMIHTTGDPEYRHIIHFQADFIRRAREFLKNGGAIFTDTKMAYHGINKPALEKSGCALRYYIDDPKVFEMSTKLQTTRSACAVDMAVEAGIRAFVVGNAPTALFRILEHVSAGRLEPEFVIGVPVGFVGAAESKEHLRTFDIPQLSTVGFKGGSNVAASVVNALLYMEFGR